MSWGPICRSPAGIPSASRSLHTRTIYSHRVEMYLVVVENTAQLGDDAGAFGQMVAIDHNVLGGPVQEVLREKIADTMRLLEIFSFGDHPTKPKKNEFFLQNKKDVRITPNKTKNLYVFLCFHFLKILTELT